MNLVEKISKNRNTLMGIATLMIVAFHIFPAKWEFVKTLYLGVDIFVLLMGFSFAYKMNKAPINSWSDYFKYIKERFIRLYLPFAIAFGFELLINYLFLSKINFKPEALLLYGILKKSLYYWYVIYAIGMTFILPLFYHFYKKVSNKTVFIFIVCLIIFILGRFLPYPLLMGRIWTCLFGVYLFDAENHFITSAGLLFLPIAFLGYFIITKNILSGFNLYSFGGIFAICFVGWYVLFFRNLKVLDLVGKYSYEIYLTLTWLSSIIFRLKIENKMFWIILSTLVLVVLEKYIYKEIMKFLNIIKNNLNKNEIGL